MATNSDIIKLAVDAYNGRTGQFSTADSLETLRRALVEANGGSTQINYKRMRDGKCTEVFSLVEQILTRTVVEGLQGDEYFNKLVDFRNIADGDKNAFTVEDSIIYQVAEIADGTQGIRRQRLGGSSTTSIDTTFKAVKIYEELQRVLEGKVDFNYFISKVAESFRQKLLNDIYTIWANATAEDFGGVTYFPAAGSYDENILLDVIAHVEAAAGGKTATIIGTKKALKNLAPSIQGSDSERDIYNNGYYGKFYGSTVVALPQRHKIGSTDFVFDDNTIQIIAGDDKPIKVVYEGDGTIISGNPLNNADMTYEYMYAEKYAVALIMAGGQNTGVGRYEMT